jgi:spermidine/putrescine transport system ATP-binding protein
MREGRIVQFGSPQELYDQPNSRYVADFVGTSNFFNGILTDDNDTLATVRLDNGMPMQGRLSDDLAKGQIVCISVRPEQMKLHRMGHGLSVEVQNRIFLGEHTEYWVQHESLGNFLVLSPRQYEQADGPINAGDMELVSWEPSAALILDHN